MKKKRIEQGRRFFRRVANLETVTMLDDFGNVVQVTIHKRRGSIHLEICAPKGFRILPPGGYLTRDPPES